MISADAIKALIPHGAGMSLIEQVVSWDSHTITAESSSHQRLDNPLRDKDVLRGIHCVEYAAQAMAIHGALLASSEPDRAPRMAIGALRDIRIYEDDLAALQHNLVIEASVEMTSNAGAIYTFEIRHTQSPVATGRITLIADET